MTKQEILFDRACGTHITISRAHVTKNDWVTICCWMQDHNHGVRPTAWKKVPDQDIQYYETLIHDNGCSFSYVSLLQQCYRNGISWIHFDKEAPLIKGLPTYLDEWDCNEKGNLPEENN